MAQHSCHRCLATLQAGGRSLMVNMLVSSIFQVGCCCCQHVEQLPLLICSPSTGSC